MTDPPLVLAALVAAVVAGVAAMGTAPSPAALPDTGSGAAEAPALTRPAARWEWPLAPRPPVLRPFEVPTSPWGPGHRGLDLAARPGEPVLAVEAGTVTHAGVLAGRGTVTVRHADGLASTYEPLRVTVREGQPVAAGDRLGTVDAGAGGSHCRGCLHLGARRSPGYLDPLPLLTGAGRVRLLPIGPAP